MTKSMTGYASTGGSADGWTWTWDIRSVNGRGFDLRLRLPERVGALEQKARSAVAALVRRGNVTVSLKLSRAEETGAEAIDRAGLDRVLRQIAEVNDAAGAAGVALTPPTAADVLSMRGVVGSDSADDGIDALMATLAADLGPFLQAFDQMRQTEGDALARILTGQLDQIAELTAQAAVHAGARRDRTARKLAENLARVMENADGADPDRVAQELAMMAVKADVTEEIDRLGAHVAAARALLQTDGPIGRKFDFLTQEFNREANTLCSKAQSAELTGVGLDLKAAIDQMREQVQNVE